MELKKGSKIVIKGTIDDESVIGKNYVTVLLNSGKRIVIPVEDILEPWKNEGQKIGKWREIYMIPRKKK